LRAPKDFTRRLDEVFAGRLRIRWSLRNGEWHIEQKVGRAAHPPYRIAEEDDSLIRARDGYAFVMAIRPGDRMPCPIDGLTLKVPVLHTAEVRCDYCRMKGREGRFKAAYYPLGENLIDHLKRIDPERNGHRELVDASDHANKVMLAAKERELSNTIEASTKDHFTSLVGIQSCGYTGKVFPGTDI
jgi:hypothetical protein